MKDKLSLLMGAGSAIKNVDLVANDNELVFQTYKAKENVNFFPDANLTIHPVDAFSVYINDELTTQKYNSLSFNAGDVIKIVAEAVETFPAFKAGGQYCVRDMAILPPMADANGLPIEKLSELLEMNHKVYKIREGFLKNNPSIKTMDQNFYNVADVTEIPEDLYSYLPDLDLVNLDLIHNTKVTEIPENLFANNPKLRAVSYFFQGCAAKGIPANIFANNPNLESVSFLCYDMKDWTTIPENLFANNPKLTEVAWLCNRSGLTEIPANLFANNHNLEDVDVAFSETQIRTIPQGLFANNPALNAAFSCFEDCTELESIPSDLFQNNPELLYVDHCFSGCSKLTSIPQGLFSNNPKITKLSDTTCNKFHGEDKALINGIFHACTSLRTIPEDLFSNCQQLSAFNGTFSMCTSLTTVPENLFANNRSVYEFKETFYGCSNLSGRIKIASPNVSAVNDFCTGAGQITVVVPSSGRTVENFRAYAATVTNLTVETY